MTLYNTYDLGIVRALRFIWLMLIPRDYPGNDVEHRRVGIKSCNGQDTPHPSPILPSAPALHKVPNVPQIQYLSKAQQMPHRSDTRRRIKNPTNNIY